jgi:microcystin-dependent protein
MWQFFTKLGIEKIAEDETNQVGLIAPYAGSSAPVGWLLCDGSAVSRTTYPSLFSALTSTYGAGDGSTTFNVPNLKGRTPIGTAAGYGDRTDTNGVLSGTGVITGGSTIAATSLGYWQGAESVQLTEAQSGIVAHSHPISSSFHNHTITIASNGNHSHGVGYRVQNYKSGGTNSFAPNESGVYSGAMPATAIASGSTGTSSSGVSLNDIAAENGDPHTNIMSGLILNFIIKY